MSSKAPQAKQVSEAWHLNEKYYIFLCFQIKHCQHCCKADDSEVPLAGHSCLYNPKAETSYTVKHMNTPIITLLNGLEIPPGDLLSPRYPPSLDHICTIPLLAPNAHPSIAPPFLKCWELRSYLKVCYHDVAYFYSPLTSLQVLYHLRNDPLTPVRHPSLSCLLISPLLTPSSFLSTQDHSIVCIPLLLTCQLSETNCWQLQHPPYIPLLSRWCPPLPAPQETSHHPPNHSTYKWDILQYLLASNRLLSGQIDSPPTPLMRKQVTPSSFPLTGVSVLVGITVQKSLCSRMQK